MRPMTHWARVRRMNEGRLRLVALAVSALAGLNLHACEGGSSGFDISASQRHEQSVIDRVVDPLACEELDGTLICGAARPGFDAPVPTLAEPVSLSPSTGQTLHCIGDAQQGCSVTVMFAGGTLPGGGGIIEAGSTVLVLAGPSEPPTGWVVGDAQVYAADGVAAATLRVQLAPDDPVPLDTGTPVRVAVVVYPPATSVPAPATVDLLSDLGADIAVVVTDLSLHLVAN